MLKLLTKYASVGVLNTAIHWLVFFLLCQVVGSSQAIANLSGFFAAASFSFFANAKFTFKKRPTGYKYVSFVFFMGALSYLTGMAADAISLRPIFTLIAFAPMSVLIGFLFNHLVIFRGK
ncbi:GtrA family protein [Enterobacter ludwigii]|uniref:GtrA family protein n=1 Tax=Enterobacter ludwigii TaxID=299767 RepID=UPI003EDAFB6B